MLRAELLLDQLALILAKAYHLLKELWIEQLGLVDRDLLDDEFATDRLQRSDVVEVGMGDQELLEHPAGVDFPQPLQQIFQDLRIGLSAGQPDASVDQ